MIIEDKLLQPEKELSPIDEAVEGQINMVKVILPTLGFELKL